MKDLGLDFYRFSISWSRVLPNGLKDRISQDGIQYYKNLIGELMSNNIKPIVTLYHWDHPQILEEMGGWTNELMVDWFADYARIIFEELGPLVKTFITVNEPTILCEQGYNSIKNAPGKTLENMGQYLCLHNMLKAHATAYHIYDKEFRSIQQGEIGIVTSCTGWVLDNNTSNTLIEQYFLFNCGMDVHPIYIGDYPEIVKARIAMISELQGYPSSRLPEFSQDWIITIKGTSDFFGLNHYSSKFPVFDPEEKLGIYTLDSGIIDKYDDSLSKGKSSRLHLIPAGFGNVLRMIRDQYNNPPVYILENGYSDNGEIDDYKRIDYHYAYLMELLKAIQKDGCNVVGYAIWSLLDSFEWAAGYKDHFGIVGVDFNSPNRTRTAKLSAAWWQEVIRTRRLQDVPMHNNEC